MKSILIIDKFLTETRCARLEDANLVELRWFTGQSDPCIGTIYLGRIRTVETSLKAAFVDIGLGKNAFMPVFREEMPKNGSYLLVQGYANQSNEDKAFRVTERIQLTGRYVVWQRESKQVGYSTKINHREDRERLRPLANPVLEKGHGLIFRTESVSASEKDIKLEIERLSAIWNKLSQIEKGQNHTGIVYEYDIIEKLSRLRMLSVDAVITNNDSYYIQINKARDEKRINPDVKVEYFDSKECLLSDKYGIDIQIQRALQRNLWLDCGGYLTVDYCEALTLYDVNSGKRIKNEDAESAALAVNLEAVQKMMAHIRLCDIGGMIVLDMINMKDTRHCEEVIHEARLLAKKDSAKTDVLGVSNLGLLELTRKRSGKQLRDIMLGKCMCCNGSGVVQSPEAEAITLMRSIKREELAGITDEHVISCSEPVSKAIPNLCAGFYRVDCEPQKRRNTVVVRLQHIKKDLVEGN